MTDTAAAPPPFEASKPIRGAGFWVRLTAHAIDLTIVMVLMSALMIPIVIRMMNMFAAGGEVDMRQIVPLWLEIPVNLSMLVVVLLLWKYAQTTPGKKLFGLRIVDARTGGKAGWGQLLLRYLGYLLASVPVPIKLFAPLVPTLANHEIMGLLFSSWLFLLPLMLGFFWICIDQHNRGWHDLMSRTIVIQAPTS